MVLEPRHCAHLDRVLLGMVRSLSGETARQTWRGTRQKKAKNVFRSWALLQAADELQVRRVRWYQSWARYPKDHHAVGTAVLGTCKVEEIVGFQRVTSEGNVCLSSTPMARQMADDISKVSHSSEEVGPWYAQRTSDVATFTPQCWERVRFLEFLGRRNRRVVELEEPFVCDENEGEEKCNERCANCRQLMAQKTRKHGVRTVLGLLTRTNERPWCRSRFVDRETALHHIYNATEMKGKCYVGTIHSSC